MTVNVENIIKINKAYCAVLDKNGILVYNYIKLDLKKGE